MPARQLPDKTGTFDVLLDSLHHLSAMAYRFGSVEALTQSAEWVHLETAPVHG